MKPILDRNKVLIDPELHDGQLLGIIVSPDREDLTLYCRRTDGVDIAVTLPDLIRLRVDNFLEGNIIFEISIREGEQCSADAVRKLWNYDETEAGQHLATLMKEIKDGGWSLIELSSSYGCELLAMSRAHADQIIVK
jgi:hypothetical protein